MYFLYDNETKLKIADKLQEVVDNLKKEDTCINSFNFTEQRIPKDVKSFDKILEHEIRFGLATFKHDYKLDITINDDKSKRLFEIQNAAIELAKKNKALEDTLNSAENVIRSFKQWQEGKQFWADVPEEKQMLLLLIEALAKYNRLKEAKNEK